jgi:O-antigen/teichoic acid export membrane protein
MLSAQPLSWAATILTTVLVPHYLGAVGLGSYAIVMTCATLLGTLLALGTSNHLIRFGAKHPDDAMTDAASSFVVSGSMALVAAVGLFLVAPFIPLPVPAALARWALPAMVFASVSPTLNAVLIARDQHLHYAWSNALSVFATVTAGLLLLLLGGGVVGFIAAGAIARGIIILLVWRVSGLDLRRCDLRREALGQLMRAGLPFLLWTLVTQVRNEIDVVLTGVILTQQTAGWLAAAYRIVSIPLFIPTLIVTPLLPALSRVPREGSEFNRILRHSFSAAFVLTIPCAAGIIGLSPSVPQIMHWPTEFYHSIPLMRILAIEQPLMAADMVLGTALIALNRERPWLKVLIVAASFNTLLNVLMLPLCQAWFQNGAVGAAGVELATELIMLGGALALLPRDALDRATVATIAKATAAGGMLWLVVSTAQRYSVPAAILLGALVYLGAIIATRAVRLDELRRLSHTASDGLKARLSHTYRRLMAGQSRLS